MSLKKDIISGAVPKKSHKRPIVITGVGMALAIIVGLALWFWLFRPKPLTPLQQSVKNTIASQEKAVHEDTQANRPADVRVLSLGNLAQSYAYIGECKKATSTLQEAQRIAPDDLKSVVGQVKKDVEGRCS